MGLLGWDKDKRRLWSIVQAAVVEKKINIKQNMAKE